jgi:nitrite reductase/ring-hydroxylating ferredoxin subunit
VSRHLEKPVLILPAPRRLGEGESVRFAAVIDGIREDCFAVCWRGGVYAYVNRCRHENLPLDFGDGHFFDEAFDALVCCHHGARYRPDGGECFAGPVIGSRLTPLAVERREDGWWCVGAGDQRSSDTRRTTGRSPGDSPRTK